MPWGDGTGPRGMGPMTGRGAGYCAGFGRPGRTNWGYGGPGLGRGFGRGFGRGPGRGFGQGYAPWGNHPWGNAPAGNPVINRPAPADPKYERQLLSEQARTLEAELERIKQRLQELEE